MEIVGVQREQENDITLRHMKLKDLKQSLLSSIYFKGNHHLNFQKTHRCLLSSDLFSEIKDLK